MWWLVAIVALILGALLSAYTKNDDYFTASIYLTILIGIGYFLVFIW